MILKAVQIIRRSHKMSIPNWHRVRMFIPPVVIIGVVILFVGCQFSPGPPPRTPSNVATVRGTAGMGEPFGIAVKDNVIYFSDGDTGTIRRIGADENVTTVASGLNTPSAIAFLPDGDIVVADTGSHTIRKISINGSVTILAGVDGIRGANDGPVSVATFNAPVGLAAMDDGSIYVSDTYNDRIRVIRDGVVSTIAGGDRGYADGIGANAKFDTPLGIAVWGDKLLVADSGNARIRLLEQGGAVSTLAGTSDRDLIDGTLSSARFVMPTAMTVDAFGRIFVADGNAIRMIGGQLFPTIETLAGNRRGFTDGNRSRAHFNRPSGLAVGVPRRALRRR